MMHNLGKVDQFLRIVAGLAIFAFLFKDGTIASTWPVLMPVALILIATAFFSFCPLYAVFGWSTTKSSKPAS